MNAHFSDDEFEMPSPEEALERLIDGARRSAAGEFAHPHEDPEYRRALVAGQHPFAAVLACADSRVAPEVIFDQGLGDLFDVRNAGNVLDDVVIGSLGYAVMHLGVPLVVVMGHSRCGAVTAATAAADAPGKLGAVLRILQPAVIQARSQPGDAVMNTVRTNVQLNVERLRSELALEAAAVGEQATARVVGAVYHLETGLVEFLEA